MFNYKIILFVFAGILLVSCKKTWMEEKPSKSVDVPTNLKDFQALLDNSVVMNDNRPIGGEISADNYYVSKTMWDALNAFDQSMYVWSNDMYNHITTDQANWNYPYRQVFHANIVLDDVDKLPAEEIGSPAWNNVKGSAHFFRGEGFFGVSQIYTKPYSAGANGLGIPLRLNADPNAKSVRAGLQETYEQVLSDLHIAAGYLPVVPLYKMRPSKPAAYALLSRVYLVMHDYPNALLYADSCLKLYDSLLDYNTLNAALSWPIPGLNKEVIFQASMSNEFLHAKTVIVDSTLYKSYDVNDMRQKMFFKANTVNGGMKFVGTYNGGTASTFNLFSGIATDEVYLTRAECYARSGNTGAALNDLNALMIKRFKTGAFVPFTAANAGEALNLILQERRKETMFRGLRWLDLRRLNSEDANITLIRKIDSQTYTLQPNSTGYVLPLPPDVIGLTGMPQNER